MQGDVGEDLLSLRLSIGSAHRFEVEPTKKRKISDEPIDKNLAVLLHARDRMLRLGCNRRGLGDDKGLQLVRLLLIYATSVDRNDPGSGVDLLRQLYRNVSLYGEPIQRVAAYFTDGLTARFMTQRSHFYRSIMADPSPEEEFSSFTAIYRATPYYQFAHFTANQAIIEAFEDDEHWNGGCLHVIDFDVSYGFQWPSLIQSLSDKATNETPITLRITGFGRRIAELRDTEARLSNFAGGCLNLFFEFEGRLRGERDQEINIQVKKNATVAVNLAFYLHTLKNYSDISATLIQIHILNPSVLTLVEKEGSRGVYSGFLSRFMESLNYFAAMFDSLDDCLPAESKERLRIENHLGRDIKNSVVANEGEKGMRYERLEKWGALMARNRFEGVRMSSRSVSQAKLLLKIKSHCSAMDEHGTRTGFRISERNEGKAISLGWQDRHLITATAWRCTAC